MRPACDPLAAATARPEGPEHHFRSCVALIGGVEAFAGITGTYSKRSHGNATTRPYHRNPDRGTPGRSCPVGPRAPDCLDRARRSNTGHPLVRILSHITEAAISGLLSL